MEATPTDVCLARADALDSCADYLEKSSWAVAEHAEAAQWLAQRNRSEAQTWRQMARQPSVPSLQEPPSLRSKLGRALTDRMVESLKAMQLGAIVESQPGFSWPRWKQNPPRSSAPCPPSSSLQGMHERGLLDVTRGRAWTITISDEGRKAVAAHTAARAVKKSSPFKRFTVVATVTRPGLPDRVVREPLMARTEKEALSRFKRDFLRRSPHQQLIDLRVETAVPPNET